MCDYGQKVARKNLEKGVIEGVFESLKNLIKNSEMTEDEAMSAIGISEKDRKMYKEKLSK